MTKKSEDLAFALNYTNIYMIDLTPTAAAPKWAYVGAGIQTIEKTPNEVIDQTAYYDGGGQASSDVTGGQMVIAFSGHRRYGDVAQDYIASLEYAYGQARRTHYRHIAPDGQVAEGDCTIANIVNGGGDANSKGTFSFEVHNDGVPSITPGDASAMPESISAETVTVKEGETSKIEITAQPEGASKVCVYGVQDPDIATVDADGTVHGIAQGSTKITCKSALKPTVICTVDVTVSEGV